LHPNYLSSLFKKITGETIVQYINRLRIKQAKKLIYENLDMTQDSISKMVGLDNLRYYYKVFKKNCGMTPGEYREKIRYS
jgi:two-component system response regulator YesN